MYFKNKDINLLNIHTGLITFADCIMYAFGVVYFLEKGFGLPIIFLGWALSHIFRFLLRPISFKILNIIGLKKGVIVGTAIYSGLYIIISRITTLNWVFFIFFLYYATTDIFYWFSYHVYYARLGDELNRGKEIGERESLGTILAVLAPILGGLTITYAGFNTVYIVASFMTLLAIIPIIYAKNVKKDKILNIREAIKKINFSGFWLWFGWALLFYLHQFVWIIIMFLTVKKYIAFGSLIALEVLFSIIIFLILGNLIDKGRAKLAMPIAFVLLSIVILGRTFLFEDVLLIILSQLLMAFAISFFRPPVLTSFYKECKHSANGLWFQFFAEMGWDIGSMISLFALAFWAYVGFDIRYIMPLAIIGVFINTCLVKKYLKNHIVVKQ